MFLFCPTTAFTIKIRIASKWSRNSLLNKTPDLLLHLWQKCMNHCMAESYFNLMVLSKWRFKGSTAVSQLGLRFANGPGQGSPLGHCPAVTAGSLWQRGWHMTHIQWQKVVRWSAVSWIETKHKLSKKSETLCHFVLCDSFQKFCMLRAFIPAISGVFSSGSSRVRAALSPVVHWGLSKWEQIGCLIFKSV